MSAALAAAEAAIIANCADQAISRAEQLADSYEEPIGSPDGRQPKAKPHHNLTAEEWAQRARDRIEYEDPYGYERGRRW